MNQEKQPLERQTPRYISSGNQHTPWLPKSQEKTYNLLVSDSDTAIRSSKDENAQFMLFCIIYTNNYQKILAGARKSETPWDKFKELAFRRGHKLLQENKTEKKNEVYMICIYFDTKELVMILIMNSELCVWIWDKVSVANK